MKSYLPLIIGMMAVTFLPRLIPLVALSDRALHPKFKKFLLCIPYTALGALIVRGVMQADGSMMPATLIGIAAAVICSLFKGGLVLSVAASITAAYLILSFF